MSEHLSDTIRDKFKHYTDFDLIRRMEKAADFEYDDESVELTRRLGEVGLAWRWRDDNSIKVYDPSEAEL